mgnify:CR=1 FL=1
MHRSSSRNKNTSARLIIMLILCKGTTRASRLGIHHLVLALIAVAIIGITIANAVINLIGSTIIWNSSSIHCVSPVRMSQRRLIILITVHHASKIYDIRVWVRLELSTRNHWTFTKVYYRPPKVVHHLRTFMRLWMQRVSVKIYSMQVVKSHHQM